MKTTNWKVLVLKHDHGSRLIGEFFKKIWGDGILIKEVKEYGNENKNKIAEKVKNALGPLEGKILTLYGSGSFHHYTYGLCKVIAREKSKQYTYLHIDHHADSEYDSHGFIGCGSFVENILEEPEAKDIILLGPTTNPKNRAFINQETLTSKNAKDTIREVLREKQQPDIYLSFDLDVLDVTEIDTYYNRGKLKLNHLIDIIEVVKEEKNIISADILGYNGNFSSSAGKASFITYATLAAKLVGKDTKELEKLHDYFKDKRFDRLGNSWVLKEEFEWVTDKLRI